MSSDRFVSLPESRLRLLRQYRSTHRRRLWLFPTNYNLKGAARETLGPVTARSIQSAFELALKASGIQKPASVHTLCHSWATHLLEAGVNLRVIQAYQGHASSVTTTLYTQLTPQMEALAVQVINDLVSGNGTKTHIKLYESRGNMMENQLLSIGTWIKRRRK